MLMASNVLSTFRLNIDCTEVLFFNRKSNYSVYVAKNKKGYEGFVQV